MTSQLDGEASEDFYKASLQYKTGGFNNVEKRETEKKEFQGWEKLWTPTFPIC